MKKRILFGLLALSTSAFADGEMIATNEVMNSQHDHMMIEKKMQPPMVTLTSARPESDNGWYLFADATYWHADVGSTDWGIKRPDSAAVPEKIDVHSLNFKWNWGFKVGIGANIDHDMWDTNFYYTWFHTQNSNSIGAPLAARNVDSLLFGELFVSGSIDWNIHYSMFDWELGRWQYTSKNLALRPHVGIKGGWINQRIKLHHKENNTGATDRFNLQNDFWGVGPSAGVNTLWVLGNAGNRQEHRFSLFGDFAGALMYGHFNIKEKASFFSDGVLSDGSFHANGLSRNLATTMLQGAMGLSWDLAFNQEHNHFMMKVGYEFQYWFRQNQLMRFFNGFTSGGGARLSDDLALQGVTAEFRFDF